MEDVKLTWFGHSCFMVDDGHIRVMFDPYQPGSVPGLGDIPSVGVNKVLISHDHADHNYDRIPCFLNLVDINYDSFEIPHDKENGKLRGMNKVHILYLGGYKIVHMGDVGCLLNDKQIEKIKDADILLIPINGYYTINALEAIEIGRKSNAKVMIPMHYYYHNSGYKDNNELDSLVKNGYNVVTISNKEINIKDYIDDTNKILVMDY